LKDTDSTQVLWRKGEKNFEKRVKSSSWQWIPGIFQRWRTRWNAITIVCCKQPSEQLNLWTHIVVLIKLKTDFVRGLIKLTSYKIDNALNLSILLSAGKETNWDFISSGERTWKLVQDLKSVAFRGSLNCSLM